MLSLNGFGGAMFMTARIIAVLAIILAVIGWGVYFKCAIPEIEERSVVYATVSSSSSGEVDQSDDELVSGYQWQKAFVVICAVSMALGLGYVGAVELERWLVNNRSGGEQKPNLYTIGAECRAFIRQRTESLNGDEK